MKISAVIYFSVAVVGAIINFCSKHIEKAVFPNAEPGTKLLLIKLCALVLVLIGISLLMIFGK